MNRRRIFIALAVFVPLAIFVAAKNMASWRPVRVGSLNPHIPRDMTLNLHASKRYVVAGAGSSHTLFNLQTGAATPIGDAGLSDNGAYIWKITLHDELKLELRPLEGPTSFYRAPISLSIAQSYPVRPDYVRVNPTANTLEVRHLHIYYRWNLTSRRLERRASSWNWDDAVLARDGKIEVIANRTEILFASTQTGDAIRSVNLPPFEPYQTLKLSPYGAYALYDTPTSDSSLDDWNIVDTATGRVIWQIKNSSSALTPVFSPDETRIAVINPDASRWAIHDSQSGALLHQIPLVTGSQSGAFSSKYAAFSPDNDTLYSVANGTLYRQRAR